MRKPTRAATAKARKAPKKRASKRANGGAPRAFSGRKAAGKSGPSALRRLQSELAAARARIEELEAAADTDFLLDIPNRRGFARALERAVAYIKRYDASGALILLDVDRLKPINDLYGHSAGDEVLKAVASSLSVHVRSSDVVGRIGGDEFALLLWNLSETDARAKAAMLEQTIDLLEFNFRGEAVTAGASAGVALLDAHSDARTVLERADAAMYVRKAQRRHERDVPSRVEVNGGAASGLQRA